MKKVTMYQTISGLLYADEQEALDAERGEQKLHAFLNAYQNHALFGDTAHGMVYAETLIEWAQDHPHAFRALANLVLMGDEKCEQSQ